MAVQLRPDRVEIELLGPLRDRAGLAVADRPIVDLTTGVTSAAVPVKNTSSQ